MAVKSAVLQSGFLTLDLEGITNIAKNTNTFKNFILNKGYMNDGNQFFFLPEVQKLYDEYISDVNSLNDFDYREKLLKVAFKSFGTLSFYDWLVLQMQSNYFTNMHRDFILDTINFIYTGKRKVQVSQWVNLLDTSDNSGKPLNPIDFTDYSKDILINIHMWVSNERGFQDLLITLYVIFGSRDFIKIAGD